MARTPADPNDPYPEPAPQAPQQPWAEDRAYAWDASDDHDEPDPLEEAEMNCGLGDDGQCGHAGSEHCDFECPFRDSEDFAGSEAWCKKHNSK